MLDPDAVAEAMDADPDQTLALLARMSAATDQRLRELARQMAGRLTIEVGRGGSANRSGTGRLRRAALRDAHGDIDLDASLDAVVRVVDLKGSATAGPGDRFEPYWESLAALAGTPLSSLPFVATTVSNERVRASYQRTLDGVLSAPSGLCIGGWYCPTGSIVATENGCPVGFYCPAGSTVWMEQPELHLHPEVQSELALLLPQLDKEATALNALRANQARVEERRRSGVSVEAVQAEEAAADADLALAALGVGAARVAAAFLAAAERAAEGRLAAAAPPLRPPFLAGLRSVFLPTPEPLFLPPWSILLTVAQARRSASPSGTPRRS